MSCMSINCTRNYNVCTIRMKYSQTGIKRVLKGTCKCALYEQLPIIYRFKLYAIFIYGKRDTARYRQ